MPDNAHIKMPDIAPVVRYLANGTQTAFVYPFPIFATEDLAVFFDGARQYSGFDINDAGETDGGTVTFDTAPASGTVVMLQRILPLERMTDFIEGGDFSAQAINNELDYLTATLQQVSREQSMMLRYDDAEDPSTVTLPTKLQRAGKALGFDAGGNPVPVSLEGSMAAPDYTAPGAGAVTRTSSDKFSDFVSVKDFGAVGDGLIDDTLAIQQALAAHEAVFVPSGTYLISSPLTLKQNQSLFGAGGSTRIKANATTFNVVEFVEDYASLSALVLESGDVGIKLYGRDRPCVSNLVSDVTIDGAQTGIVLDGYTDINKPCYWNRFRNVLILKPAVNGIHLTRSGAGDTPNANNFNTCRVYSLGVDITGAGIYVEYGAHYNSFTDCEVNVKGTADSCVRIGSGSLETVFTTLYTESNNLVTNVKLDAGSKNTSLINLYATSNGAAIWDFSGGSYIAHNAGYPNKTTLPKAKINDLTTKQQRYDHVYTNTSGTLDIDISNSVHFLSSFDGPLTVRLPAPIDADGAEVTMKKIDGSSNIITITSLSGTGPDMRDVYLGGEHDFVTVVSNGAEWFITASNQTIGNTRYYDGTGTYDIDMAVDTYLLSAYSGSMTARLPPANAPEAVRRTITIKKIDVSSNAITVTELGGNGPDQTTHSLSNQYNAITLISDGGQWFVISKY